MIELNCLFLRWENRFVLRSNKRRLTEEFCSIRIPVDTNKKATAFVAHCFVLQSRAQNSSGKVIFLIPLF